MHESFEARGSYLSHFVDDSGFYGFCQFCCVKDKDRKLIDDMPDTIDDLVMFVHQCVLYEIPKCCYLVVQRNY